MLHPLAKAANNVPLLSERPSGKGNSAILLLFNIFVTSSIALFVCILILFFSHISCILI